MSVSTKWNQVEAAVDAAPGVAGVSLIAPDGERWGRNEDDLFPAASVIKIAIMVEVFRQRDAGEYALDDLRTVTNEDKAPGSGIIKGLRDGVELSINDLLYLMISISDNTATNLLIDVAGMDRVNSGMRSLGLERSVLARKMQNREAGGEQRENYCVPSEFSRLVQMILNGEAGETASCHEMVDLLKSQANRARLARPLDRDDETIEFGSKTGTLKTVCNDAGFYRKGEQELVLSVFLKDQTDTPAGEAAIGEIARAALTTIGMLPQR